MSDELDKLRKVIGSTQRIIATQKHVAEEERVTSVLEDQGQMDQSSPMIEQTPNKSDDAVA